MHRAGSRDRAELAVIGSATNGEQNSDAQMNGTFISVDGTGTVVRRTVGIRNRGHGSRNRKPNSFRVNFNADHLWKGVSALNINGPAGARQIPRRTHSDGGFSYSSPDDASAINWLKTAPLGIVVEAVGGQYSEYARAATYSGQPNVLGWPGHEGQWRGGYTEVGSREEDIRLLYETRNWDDARSVIDQYDIKYIYVGNLERNTYNLFDEKFRQLLPVAYEQGSVTIYVVP